MVGRRGGRRSSVQVSLRVLPAACLYIAPLHLSWRHFCPSAFFHFCCFYDFCPRFFLFYFVFRDNFSDCLVAVSRGGVPGAAGGAGEVRTLYLLIFFSVDLFKTSPIYFLVTFAPPGSSSNLTLTTAPSSLASYPMTLYRGYLASPWEASQA